MDDKSKAGPQDRSRINVHEAYEVRYWSQHFDVTEEELIAAVDKVGVSAKAVEEHFKGLAK